jgi:hypothetical protein
VTCDNVQRRGDRPKRGEPGYVDERATTGRRGYRWPQFTKGNQMSSTHGAGVPAIVDPIADALVAGLLADRPDLERHPEAVAAWGRAESRCILLAAYMTEHGLVDGDGKETVSARLVNQCERMANEMRQRLGLDPRSEAELANVQADAAHNVVDLEALRARGRAALEKHHERERLREDVNALDADEETQ